MAARKPLSIEQLQKREQAAFSRRIRTMFGNAGFTYLPTHDKHRHFGSKKGEIDQAFLFENIILLCEDTVLKSPRDHLKNKKLLADEVMKHPEDTVSWLKESFPDRFESYEDYDPSRYKIYYLYFSKFDLELDKHDLALFAPVRVVTPATLNYFVKMAQNIKRSIRADIFRFLGLKTSDLGLPQAGGAAKMIPTAIIYPADNTGFKNGVRVVSFMMSAEMLLRNSYVLRKDNWQETIELYQRLIERERIQKIRKFLVERKSTFINNVIVSLPSGVKFQGNDETLVPIKDISDFSDVQMLIPDEMNSICVIDGQHRIYAHYEGIDATEPEVAKLRRKFHLLVTGLIFPDAMPELERRKFESELFLDINSNARPVPQDVLLFIETLKDPFSDLGIARQVLKELNLRAPFRNSFQLSLMDDAKIKIASIIKFALRYLVDLVEAPDRLFMYWEDETKRAELLTQKSLKADLTLLNEYVEFCAQTIATFFCAVKSLNQQAWNSPDSKVLSTTSINGFIIALRRSLPTHGVGDFHYYKKQMKDMEVDFSKEGFKYASSQYAKFSREILKLSFGVEDVGGQDGAQSTQAPNSKTP